MPDADTELPFKPPLPRRRRKKQRYPLLKALLDSLAEPSFKPLLDYARKEWKSVKRYPGFLSLASLIVAGAVWYFAHWWYVQKPYSGETRLKLFFPGGDQSPVLVYQKNIYRYTTYRGTFHITSPGMNEKGQPITITTNAQTWDIFVIFEHEVNFDVKAITWETTINPQPHNVIFHECGRRGISMLFAEDLTTGYVDVKVTPAIASPDLPEAAPAPATPPSPTPSKEASQPSPTS